MTQALAKKAAVIILPFQSPEPIGGGVGPWSRSVKTIERQQYPGGGFKVLSELSHRLRGFGVDHGDSCKRVAACLDFYKV